MCLAVYIGTSLPLDLPGSFGSGEMGIETAKWTPAPLKRAAHVYFAGRKGEGAELECSCLLSEHVQWVGDKPNVVSDDLYPENGACPFDVLRGHCEQVLDRGGAVMIVCDDGGGVEQEDEVADYDSAFLITDQIARCRLVFADVSGGFPCRAFQVLRFADVQKCAAR